MHGLYVSKIMMKGGCEDSYVAELPVVRWLRHQRELRFEQPVTFFVGENGTGKSTLIEAIAVACGFNAEGGSKNFNFATRDTTSGLADFLTVARSQYPQDGFFLRAESFYNVATAVEELELSLDGYGGRSLHDQSHGESFLALVQNRFRGHGLYLMDEPEAALSPSRQLTLIAELHRLVGEGSQFIIATHSPLLLAYPQATIYQLSESGVEQVAYEECAHYQLTKRFLNDHTRLLKYLLEE